MNYNKLHYFYTVAQTLNFSKAANELYISQSAVSRHMKELEEDFGTPLFIRTNRDLILTEAGKVLYNEIRMFFSQESQLYQKVRAAAEEKIRKLNIGFMGIRPAYHIPAIVQDSLREYPDLSVNLRRYNWDGIIPALNSGEIDVGLRLRMGNETNAGFEHFILDKDYPAIIVSTRHAMAERKHAVLTDFMNDTFLLLSKKDSAIPFSYTVKLFQKHGLTMESCLVYDQVETILMMIHADAGISLLSRFAPIDQFSDLVIVDLDGIEPLYLELVWKKTNTNPMIPAFADRLKKDTADHL